MNNACPECGKTYAVSAEHVGRKVTCKQCHKKLVVGPSGLEFAGAAQPAADEGGGFGFGGGGAGYTPGHSPPPPPPSGGYGGKADDGYGGEAPARRQRSGLAEFLTFRRFIVPTLIQVIFWIEVVLILGGAAVFFGMSLLSKDVTAILVAAGACVIGIPVAILVARIYCELLILGFRLLDSMNEIRDLLENQPR
jgi:hypothetical protein